MSKTFASLFTGFGLADIGAMMAGYELLWGVELESAIASVANANLPHLDQVHVASVVGFDWGSVERPDHLHMSPPCQDFSVAKRGGGVRNANDDLAAACVEAVTALRPDSVTLENVEGYGKSPGFRRVVDALWGLGYWVNVSVLNACDFGVPQSRRRMMLRAVLGQMPQSLPEPTRWMGWLESIDVLVPALTPTKLTSWQQRAMAIHDVDPSTATVLIERCGARAKDGVPDNKIRHAHQPAFTIKAMGGEVRVNPNQATVVIDGRPYKADANVLGIFQSVPYWYEYPRDLKLAVKGIGNGVPCKMMAGVLGVQL